MSFGVTSAGFRLKRLEDLKAELEEDFRAAFGENIDLSADEIPGQIIAVISERRASDWEALQAVYHSFFASQAQGISLDRLGELRGVARRAESFSTGFVTFEGTPSIEIPAGTRIRDELGQQVETLVTVVTDASTGLVTVPVRALVAGPVTFAPASLTTLVTSVFGIDSVINAEEIKGGLKRESDEEFRIRSSSALTNPGTSNVEGIKNKVAQVPFVLSVIIAENSADVTDGSGRPPHSFETYVLTSLTGSITDYPDTLQAVASAIWNAKPAGIQTHGAISVLVLDSQGFSHEVKLTEATQTPIVISVTVTANQDTNEGELFPILGVDMIKSAIVEYGNSLQMGRDVWLNRIAAAVSGIPGVKAINALTINGAAENLSVNPVELPVFDTDTITVTVL